jgi:hypothetical protein
MKAKLIKLTLALGLLVGTTFVAAPKAESACIAICTGGSCCCGRLAAYDYCTGKPVCVSQCLSPG